MAIEIISKLKPKNNGDFKLIDAKDIEFSDFQMPVETLQKATDYADDASNNALIEAKKYVDAALENVGDLSNNSGISDTAKKLILSLFESSVYNNPNMETQYNALKQEWNTTSKKEYCTVTYDLTNVTSSNINLKVEKGLAYTSVLTPYENCELNSIIITVNGNDVTSSVYSASTKEISISSVTGNIVITAIATEKIIPIERIDITPTTASMNVGDTLTLTAVITPSNASNKNITWSANNNLVTVTNGVVEAISAGTTIITAKTNNNKSAACQISIKAVTIPVQSISFAETTGSTTVGKIIKLTPIIVPSNATEKTITWTSSKKDVATVDNGSISALTVGETVITATIGDKTATYTLTVNESSISTENLIYDLPSETTFSHDNGTYIDTGVKLFEDISTKKNYTILCDVVAGNIIATPDTYCLFHCMEESGNYPGLSGSIWGNGDIGINLYGLSASVFYGSFTTKGDRSKIAIVIDQSKSAIYPSKIAQLTSISKYNTNVAKSLILGAYQTSDGTKGRYFDGTIKQFTVYDRILTDEEIDAFTSEHHISLDVSTKTIKNGESFTLTATKSDIDGTIGWKTSDANIISINNGVVSALGVGTAVVFANVGEYYTKCIVTVEESDSSTEDATCVYKLDDAQTFSHDNGTYIDTGVKLFENVNTEKPTWTILIDHKGGENLTATSDTYCLLHCMEESGNYPGLSIAMLSTENTQMCLYSSKDHVEYSLANIKKRRGFAIEIKGGQYRINMHGSFGNWITINNYNINVAKSLILGAYQTSSGVKGRYWDGTVYRFEIWKGSLSESSITEWISKAVDDADTPTVDDKTCVYSLPSETTFSHDNGTYIDTGVKLFENVNTEKPTWTILYDIDFGSNIQAKADTYCVFHCMEETSPWNGLSCAIWAKGTLGLNIYGKSSDASANKTVAGTRIKGGLVISGSTANLRSDAVNKTDMTITNYSGNVNKTLILGAYQTSDGTKGRFFDGTFHRFKVYNRALTNDEIDAFIAE